MLTRRGRAVLLLALVLLVAGRILGVTELFGFAAAAIAVVIFGVVRVRAPQLRIALSAQVAPPVISVGDLAALEITIENTGTVPTPSGRLEVLPASDGDGPLIEVPRLVPGESATVALRLPTSRRGRHQVAGFDAVVVDALGTARRRVTALGTTRYGVRPAVEPLSETLPSGGIGADLETTLSSAERLRSGASLLRPYLAGDDLRRIHWLTTARVGDLMVREGGDRERDSSGGASVVLCSRVSSLTPGGLDRFEDSVRVAASLIVAASREGSFRLTVPGDIDTGEGTSFRHLEAVFEALTDVRAVAADRGEAHRFATADPGAFEDKVVFFIAACEDWESMAELLGAQPDVIAGPSSTLVAICTASSSTSAEFVSRRHLVVRLAPGESLEELWSGESSLVRS